MREFFATLTKPRTIQRIILIMIIASILATIFTLVVILIPNLFSEWVHIRESVLTLATCGMVLATLILAFGTFSIIMHDRERQHLLRKERCVNEIIAWATDVIDFTAGQTALRSKDIIEVTESGVPIETIIKIVAGEQKVKLNRLSSKSLYIVSLITRLFPNNTDLLIAIHNVRRKIYERIRYLELEMKGLIKNTSKPTQILLTRLLQEATSLLEVAVNTYTKIE